MKKRHLLLPIVIICAGVVGPVRGQQAAATPSAHGELPDLQVGVIIAPPFILEQNGSLTGFSIDLWNAITEKLKRKTVYQIEPDTISVEQAMRSKTIDVTAAPVFITSARDEEFDFSVPIVEAGLQVMVRDTQPATLTANPLWPVVRLILSQTTVLWLSMALLLVLVPAHIIWLLEWRREGGMISSHKYFPGIFEAIFWSLSTLTSQAQTMPSRWIGRAFAVFWMFAGVVFIAFYTAQLTTTLTVEQFRSAIEGPDDLPGKRVATVARSLVPDYLRELHAQVQEFATGDDMFKALVDKQVDAVVFSGPVLRYYAAHEGQGRVKLVGPEVRTAPIAFTVQLNSPLRKGINGALLALREDGSFQRLYDKWFGGP